MTLHFNWRKTISPKRRDFLKGMGLGSVALLAEPTLMWGQTSDHQSLSSQTKNKVYTNTKMQAEVWQVFVPRLLLLAMAYPSFRLRIVHDWVATPVVKFACTYLGQIIPNNFAIGEKQVSSKNSN